MSEKRKSPRATLDILVNKFLGGVPFMARTRDISSEGVSLDHLNEPRFDGRQVGIQFQLPGQPEVIYAEGEIIREQRFDGGDVSSIRFTLLTDRHRRLIHQYVDRNA